MSLPKGGGAIRGMGEKFAANPVTGTGSLSVPIATSPGRSGFGPHLSLGYDSGSGNGPFGMGWSLALPSIQRKTDKGLPRYLDAEDSDTFILSGSEDLVPLLVRDGGKWHEPELTPRVIGGVPYRIRRYRPRLEGLFARIERWTNTQDPTDVFWRSISRDNVTTWFGRSSDSRISDPGDPTRIFSWLICQSHDDKGNVTVYGYKPEDSARVLEDSMGNTVPKAHERNRTEQSRAVQRYLKRIRYGNRSPYYPALSAAAPWPEPPGADVPDGSASWMFEVVLDYGEHARVAPAPAEAVTWPARNDAFSTYRAGFELRTYRTCQRVLLFHHFPTEPGVDRDCLVASTDFEYSDEVDPTAVHNPSYTFLRAVTRFGYRRSGGGYLSASLPPLEFTYTQPVVQTEAEDVDPASLVNLPIGLDGTAYRWIDLHGEGVPGILTEQSRTWYYKRNLSPLQGHVGTRDRARFATGEPVGKKPNTALADGAQIMDLAGDGTPDLVLLKGPGPGLYEHDDDGDGWQPFRPFTARLTADTQDPNLKFVDLDGDGRTDVLITQDDVLVWHESLAEDGFGPARTIPKAVEEEQGPRVVFADGTESVHLADLSGDGLTDLVRIRNGEVCYWPNLGRGRFGAKVTMDNAPLFDNPDQFTQTHILLADIDGSGTTDIIYLHRDGARLYFNQSGNSWSRPATVSALPRSDDAIRVTAVDLLGNGTACLVWSSPLPAHTGRPMRYVNLMGADKPHLLVAVDNNLGAETRIRYAPSTKFYLQDRRDGVPWLTKLPFPVHVVEQVDTYDHVGRNRFATRYAYHHGYYDGLEREFRGFGMVEQWDTASFSAFTGIDTPAANITAESHVPPIHTKTWYHTGVFLGRERISRHFAGLGDPADRGEYYREPSLSDEQASELLLPDTVLPDGLSLAEEREACRALKGSMLRQEVYAEDTGPTAAPAERRRSATPYTVTEQSFTIRPMQPLGSNHHAVFLTHTREAISYHYERNPADPRVGHILSLEVDQYGNQLKRAEVAYGRRAQVRLVDGNGIAHLVPNPGLASLHAADRATQTTALLTYTEQAVTNSVDDDDHHRIPLPSQTVTFELTDYPATGPAGRYQHGDLVEDDPAGTGLLRHRFDTEVAYEATAHGVRCRRPIERVRTLHRSDDLSHLLPLGKLESLALPGEQYRLAFTPGLLEQAYRRPRAGQPDEVLLTDPAAVLASQSGDGGGYVASQALKADGRFPTDDPDWHWWMPSGRAFLSADPLDTPGQELSQARQGFFLPRRYRDPFGQDTHVTFDSHQLMPAETSDPVGNRVSVDAHDYRVLQPRLLSDPNRNQAEVAFDALGLVVGTAVMGKPLPAPVEGDSLAGFVADLDPGAIAALLDVDDPHDTADSLLRDATTRIVHDLHRFRRTRQAHPDQPTAWQPACVATLTRETHATAALPPQGARTNITVTHSDGFGRVIQSKVQAEPGPLDVDDPNGAVQDPRWVSSGWTISNNKGHPVRRYEPFFCATHRFEFGVTVGVSPVLFYDPADRVVATLHPNHSYDKVQFDAWQRTTYDVNDTCASRNHQTGDPRTDPDIAGHVAGYFAAQPAAWQTWHAQRIGGQRGVDEQRAAARAGAHADTPTTAHVDPLGRTFLTVVRNRVDCPGHDLHGSEEALASRVELDIEGNERAVRDPVEQAGDPLGRVVMRYAHDMLGTRIRLESMEAGTRWMLNDAGGRPIRTWDSRGHDRTTRYDPLRRPTELTVRGTMSDADPSRPNSDPRTLGVELLVDRIEYGEAVADAETLNLRTRIYRHLDSAGIATNAGLDLNGTPLRAFDFKGNPLSSTRRLLSDHTELPDWRSNPALQPETFQAETRYDALNRPIQSIAPRSSLPRATATVIQPTFNEAGLLERLDVWLERATAPAGILDPSQEPPDPVGVVNIDYDAKGQRRHIAYANGATTSHRYDPDTLRLIELYTRRGPTFTNDADNPHPPPATVAAPATPLAGIPAGLQRLRYTYDPAGNLTTIRDDAQQALFFSNKRVEPGSDFTYDATYRLVEATGREHLGQAGAPVVHSLHDDGRVGLASAGPAGRFAPSDGAAMGTYTERYVYDRVGNILRMQHRGTNPAHPGWTRQATFSETSLLEGSKSNNRLTNTQFSNGVAEAYLHDVHGNMLRMPDLGGGQPGPNLAWDHLDRLSHVDLGGGGDVWYVYDAAGQRVRKVWQKAPGRVEERICLGGFEIHRRHQGPIGEDTAVLERETLHVMDDTRRVALVETRTLDTAGNDQAPRRLIRYQFGNHLGSASLELDDAAQIVSYEEYAPYGSTTHQAVRSTTETPKRYRFTGKERDEESGLYYHGARYYSPWLGRWTSADPAGLAAGLNTFAYCRGNPTGRVDGSGYQDRPTTAVGLTFDSSGVRFGPFTSGPSPETDITFRATGPMRRVEMAPHVDEVDAVRGNLAGGVAGSPSDAANKQFLDPRTNVQTKSNFVSNAPKNPRPPISAAASPQEAGNRLLTGVFSEVEEMKPLAEDAASRTAPGVRTNSALRSGMKADPAIRGALSSVGVNPDTLKAENPPGVQQFPKSGTVNLSRADADLDAATGRVVPGPNTTAAMQRRADSQAQKAGAATRSGGSSSGSTGQGSSAGANLRSGTSALAGNVGRMVPGVVEAELGLTGAAMYASSYSLTSGLVTPLLTAAEAVPVVAGAGVLGAGAGHLARAGAEALGADQSTAVGVGLGAAVLTGAVIGSAIPGVGTAVGAGIGALVAAGMYLWSL